MCKSKQRSLRRPIAVSWFLIWFGTILVVNPDRWLRYAGIAAWGVGILIQYGMACIWFTGRPSSGVTAERPRPRVGARVVHR
jgi:hypothetical protein